MVEHYNKSHHLVLPFICKNIVSGRLWTSSYVNGFYSVWEALVNLGLNSSLINFDKIDVVQINTVFILNLFIGVFYLNFILHWSIAIYFYDNVQIIP